MKNLHQPDQLDPRTAKRPSVFPHVQSGVDWFSEACTTLRIKSSSFCFVNLSAPWNVHFEQMPGLIRFIVVVAGEGWMEIGHSRQLFHAKTGDLFVLSRNVVATFKDNPASDALGARRILPPIPPDASGPVLSEVNFLDGDDAQLGRTRLAVGTLNYHDSRTHPLLNALPFVMTTIGSRAGQAENVAAAARLLALEMARDGTGRSAMLEYLANIIIVQAMRAHMSKATGHHGSLVTEHFQQTHWSQGSADPRIGRALAAIHDHPDRRWTVESLAEHAAVSRSSFAARFTEIVGEPPLKSLTRWRMHKAASLLVNTQSTITEITSRVGYESEPSFTRAFRHWFGDPPGVYRRKYHVMQKN